MKTVLIVTMSLFLCFPIWASEQRDMIGEVFGKPVYRDQIKRDIYLYGQLHRLFRAPFEKQFIEEHKDELKLETWEIEYVAAYYKKMHEEKMKTEKEKLMIKLQFYEKQLEKENLTESERNNFESKKEYVLMDLEPPDNSFYEYLLSHWKFHRLLYNKFGGGRVIWEQEGLVAFDAMLKWIKFHEEKGDFKILDSELHKAFYSYWTEMDENSSFFLDESDLNEFIHPEWEPIRRN